MGGSGRICLPTGSHLGQVVEKLQHYPCRGITLIAPTGPTCLVLESLGPIRSDFWVPVQPALSTIESDSSQESVKIRSACMAPKAIKEQGFSKAVAVGIEAQRGSTRSVIADNWVCHQFQHNQNLARLLDSLQRQT